MMKKTKKFAKVMERPIHTDYGHRPYFWYKGNRKYLHNFIKINKPIKFDNFKIDAIEIAFGANALGITINNNNTITICNSY